MKRTAVPREGLVSPSLAQLYLSVAARQPWPALAAMLAINAALAALLLYLEFIHGIDHWDLVRDANAVAGQPAYFGAYSYLGILAWAAGASVAVFSWLLLRNRMAGDERLRVLGLGGLFTTVACLDDLFMLHENSWVIGISDKAVMMAYVMLLLAFVMSALPVLHRTKWLLLLPALGALGSSFVFDLYMFPGSVFMEEVCKLTGISLLAAYLLTLSWSAIADAIQRGTSVRPASPLHR